MSAISDCCFQTYRTTDPAQYAFREAIATFDEATLVDLENDLERYARCGSLSSLLKRIIDTANVSTEIA